MARLRHTTGRQRREAQGIKPVADPTPGSTIGFSDQEQKYYGWSHRAMAGFGVGDTVKKGDVLAGKFPVGFKAETLEDARRMAEAFSAEVS